MTTTPKTVKAFIAGRPCTLREVALFDSSSAPGSDRVFLQSAVVCEFRTGTKRHTAYPVGWLQPDGTYRINATQVVHNRHAAVIGWKDDPVDTNSGWTG